jgi:hypothetical protein
MLSQYGASTFALYAPAMSCYATSSALSRLLPPPLPAVWQQLLKATGRVCPVDARGCP